MESKRTILADVLDEICKHVYYQPPESVRLHYPCIVYKLAELSPWHANNKVYHHMEKYTLTVIDQDPDSELRDVVSELRFCRMTRSFENDNLHHWVFNIYV